MGRRVRADIRSAKVDLPEPSGPSITICIIADLIQLLTQISQRNTFAGISQYRCAMRLVTRLWRDQPGSYFVICTKDHRQRWKETFFAREELDRVDPFIRRNRDKDVYFCPHGLLVAERRKEYAVAGRLLWSDLDQVDPRTLDCKPTIAIESSPGKYVGLWKTDDIINEEMNRRLTYMIGADKSGWDFTQVLRVPGTINYKYTSTPVTRLLWSNGPVLQVETIKSSSSSSSSNNEGSGLEGRASKIFSKWEKKLPRWVRAELLNGSGEVGRRSDMVWKLEQEMIERGIPQNDIFVLIKASPWNKFRGRRDEDHRLRTELKKSIGRRLNGGGIIGDDSARRLIFRRVGDVEEENIDWIYYPYLARGELSIFEGDPGIGKSYLAQIIGRYICDGEVLPSVEPRKVSGEVLYFDIENNLSTTTKKRLICNDLKNVNNFIQCEEAFSVKDPNSMDEVYSWVDNHRPLLVVFDTLNNYIGGVDYTNASLVQDVFVKFQELARRYNVAVMVLRHLTKSTKEKALYRGQGSIGFTAMARIVVSVGAMPEDTETKVFGITKLNVARHPPSITFTIDSLPDEKERKGLSKLTFGGFVNLNSEQFINVPSTIGGEKGEAAKFLIKELISGPVMSKALVTSAESRGISQATLYRAAQSLGVVRKIVGHGEDRSSIWSLPEKH
jgi:hypothetical protein